MITGCGSNHDIVIKPLEAEFIADKEIDYRSGEYVLKISTGLNWIIEKPYSDDWYTISTIAGQGNQTVTIKIFQNNTEIPRSGEIIITAGRDYRIIKFTQDEYIDESLYYPIEEAYRIEMPRLSKNFTKEKSTFIIHYAKDNVGDSVLNYSFEYNYSTNHTRWVAFTFYDKTSQPNTKRSNAWSVDPKLLEFTDNFEDYRGSGYDRGHLVASADRLYSVEANEQTFYYSNISPQIPNFNSGIWAFLEEKVRNWGRSNAIRDTLYVTKGGTIAEKQTIGTIGNNKIIIPKYYFMALLAKKGTVYKSIAFLFEHKKYDHPYDLQKHVVSVEELEKVTGIDFFHNLPDEIERQVEQQKNMYDWPDL